MWDRGVALSSPRSSAGCFPPTRLLAGKKAEIFCEKALPFRFAVAHDRCIAGKSSDATSQAITFHGVRAVAELKSLLVLANSRQLPVFHSVRAVAELKLASQLANSPGDLIFLRRRGRESLASKQLRVDDQTKRAPGISVAVRLLDLASNSLSVRSRGNDSPHSLLRSVSDNPRSWRRAAIRVCPLSRDGQTRSPAVRA
jgi:hypothetical protein